MPDQAKKIFEQKRSLKGLYAIGILSTAIGLTVIVILNMFTPLEYILDQLTQSSPDGQFLLGWLIVRRFLGLMFLIVLSSCLLLAIMRQMLKPVPPVSVKGKRLPVACYKII